MSCSILGLVSTTPVTTRTRSVHISPELRCVAAQMELWASIFHVPKEGGGSLEELRGHQAPLAASWRQNCCVKDGELMEQMINDVISSMCAVIHRQ